MHSAPQIPDHELLRLIGRGAYGEVWLARNVMGVMRAVKVVRRASFESHRPFEREFAAVKRYEPVSRAAAGLVNVLHAGRAADGELFYYVMELADAAEAGTDAAAEPDKYVPCTLRTMIGRLGRLPVGECSEIAVSLADGIAALHRVGLVHRDVKPSNIIFVNGRAKLADIGLVGDISESRSYVGTEGYVPPEGPGQPGADLYGLGRVFYEMVTGYEATRFPALPADWAQRGEAGAFEFYEVVLRCCEPDAERRYERADELLADLALLQSGQSVRQVRQMRGRIAVLKKFAVAAALAGLAAAGVAWWQGREADAQRRLVERAERAEADAQRNLFDGMVPQARYARLSGAVDARFTALALLEKAAALRPGDAAVREEFIAALATPGLRRVSDHASTALSAVFDPALSRCLSTDAQYALRLTRLPGGELLREWPRPADTQWVFPVHVNAEGLCAVRDDKGRLHRWQDGAPLPLLEADGAGDCHWSVTDDSARAVAWRTDGTVTVVPLTGGGVRHAWKCALGFRHGPDHGAVLCANGNRAAFCQGGGSTVLLHSLEDGVLRRTLNSPRPLSGTLAVSADGGVVACGLMDGGIAIWRPDGTAACEIIEAGSSFISALAMAPDGRFLITLTWAAVTKLWDLADGTCVGRLEGQASALRFSRDGTALAALAYGGRCAQYEFAPGVCQAHVVPRQHIHSPASLAGQTFTFALHPRAPFLLYRSGGDLHLADAAALRPLRHWPVRAAFEHLSSDGRWLYLGGRGVTRLPLEEKDGAWSVGLPQVLQAGREDHSFHRLAATPDGAVAAALCSGQSFHILDAKGESGKVPRVPDGPEFVALHPSGKFLCDTTRNGPVRVVRAPGGEAVQSWPVTGEWPVVNFSPDGRFLAWTDSRGLHTVNTATWEPAWESAVAANGALGTFFSYDPTGRFLLIRSDPGTLELLDSASGRTVLRLRRNRESWGAIPALDAAGGLLCELDYRAQCIWRWDLHTVRRELRARGLDWTDDPLPPPLPDKAPELRGLLLNLPALPPQ